MILQFGFKYPDISLRIDYHKIIISNYLSIVVTKRPKATKKRVSKTFS